MSQAQIIRRLTCVVGFFILLSLFLTSVCVWQALAAGSEYYTCSSPVARTDLVRSFYAGNRGLDGDGDGIPCENRR